MPSWAAFACSVRMAVSGSASRVTCDPTSETDWPVHSLRKSGCCRSPPSRFVVLIPLAGQSLDRFGIRRQVGVVLCLALQHHLDERRPRDRMPLATEPVTDDVERI